MGRRDIDSYGVFPPDGAALVRELDAGRSVPDAERWYEATYGEKVDIDGLVPCSPTSSSSVATTSRWPARLRRSGGSGWGVPCSRRWRSAPTSR